ncbi:MAG: type II methionyl aminopeptidase, partial [Thaumarchaeota archaeon]
EYLDICEKVEGEIVQRGGRVAFPTGVGVNSVTAHYAPQAGESGKVGEKDVVKVDFGVHVDGYVADTSITTTYNPQYQPMLEATERALRAAIDVLRRDRRIGEVSKAIYSAASRYGFKTISNLSGHTLDRYVVHAGKSIPNVYMPNLPTLKKGEVFAVEPFLTTREAEGYVVDSDIETIFALVGRRRIGNGELDALVEMIWGERKTLPFTPRWFLKDYREARLLSLLKELAKKKVIRSYATLVEASGKPVAQFEHTMALDEEEGLVILT